MAGPVKTLGSPWPPLAIRPCRKGRIIKEKGGRDAVGVEGHLEWVGGGSGEGRRDQWEHCGTESVKNGIDFGKCILGPLQTQPLYDLRKFHDMGPLNG
jgi:hypothetical protein